MHPVQFEIVELNDFGLHVAMPYEKGPELIETILIEEDAKYTEIWQSKYNSYVSYDHIPFCQDGFVANYFIEGNTSFLMYLKDKINNVLNERRMLENCYAKESVDGNRTNFK